MNFSDFKRNTSSIHTCLINLPSPHLKQPEAQVPLGILYIAAVLEIFHYSVEIENLSSYINNETAVKSLPDADIYGITCTSMQVLQAGRFAREIKKYHPHSHIILGGPGTITPEYIDCNYIDSVVHGEGEYVILQILEDFENKTTQATYYGEPVLDLDTIPLPARHLVKHQGGDIFAYGKNYTGGGSTQIITSRGCPFNCAFCAAPQLRVDKRVRFRSAKSIRDEIEEVTTKYHIKQFRIGDDNFFTRKDRCYDIADAFAEFNSVFRISTRVKPLDRVLWAESRNAGLKEFSFGVESFDDTVLEGLNKLTTVADNKNALRLAMELGISTRILMMIRTPFQTAETVLLNKKALQNEPFSIIACTHFLPLPGSDVWSNPEKYRIKIIDKNLDHYNFYNYGPEGRRHLLNIFEYLDRDTQEVNKESEDFLLHLESLGKVNRG